MHDRGSQGKAVVLAFIGGLAGAAAALLLAPEPKSGPRVQSAGRELKLAPSRKSTQGESGRKPERGVSASRNSKARVVSAGRRRQA
jgi:gas vesicle protein